MIDAGSDRQQELLDQIATDTAWERVLAAGAWIDRRQADFSAGQSAALWAALHRQAGAVMTKMVGAARSPAALDKLHALIKQYPWPAALAEDVAAAWLRRSRQLNGPNAVEAGDAAHGRYS